MQDWKLLPNSYFWSFAWAGVLNLLVLAPLAQGQSTRSHSGTPASQAAPAKKSPSKATGELPPPTPAGERSPLAPNPNPFPKAGLGLDLAPGKGDDKSDDEPGYFGAITDDHQRLPGVRIVEVVGGGPAELAGLRDGDLITSINEQPVREMADLAKVFSASRPGQQLKIVYQRGATLSTPGREATLSVTLGERPPEQARRYAQFGRIDEDAVALDQGDRPTGMLLGVRTAPLDLANQRRLGVPVIVGAMVLEVTPGSSAALAGIPRDAVIVSINGLLVDSPDALTREVLKAGPAAEVELGYYLGRNPIKRRIVLGGLPQEEAEPVSRPGNYPPGLGIQDEATAVRIRLLEQQVQELQRRVELLEEKLQN